MIKWLNFTGIFWLLPGVQQVDCLIAVDWYIKVTDIEYNVGLRKYFCITVSMQKISSIHELTLQIQQILESHELNGQTHFWPSPTKNHWNNFTEFALSCKKSVHSIYSFLKYSQLLDPMTRPTKKIFDQLLVYVNLHQHAKMRLFYRFLLEIWLIKKSCNLIDWEHFGPYLRDKNLPKQGVCVGTQQIIYIFIIEQIQ